MSGVVAVAPAAAAETAAPMEAAGVARDLANLDFMRALAVLFVVADHVLETTGELLQRSYHPYDHYLGRLGVLVFFVHTSLVLMLSMDRSRVVGLPFFTSFYARRAFRIYPLSIVCVLLMLALDAPPVAWATEAAPAFSAFSIAANLALVQNLVNAPLVLSPLWSLPLELQMYAVLPFIHRQLRRGNAVRTVWLLWALTVAFAIVQPLIHGLGRLTVARFGPCFLAGVLAYVLLRRETPRWPALAWAGLLGAATLGYIAVALVSPSVHPAWLGWAFCLTLGLGIPTFRQIRSPWLRRASHSVAQYWYGVYLFHMLALWIGFGPTAPWALGPIAGAVATLVLLVAAPVLSFHLIEQPMIGVGTRVAGRLAPRRAAA